MGLVFKIESISSGLTVFPDRRALDDGWGVGKGVGETAGLGIDHLRGGGSGNL